jgi:hypothetical protein
MILQGDFASIVQRPSDIVLNVQSDAILNHGAPRQFEGDLAGQPMHISRALLAEALDPACGLLDYARLKKVGAYARFQSLTHALRGFDLDDLGGGPANSVFWINIDTIILYDLQYSMMRRPGIFRQAAFEINGLRFSADDIEHGIMRCNRPNPVLPMKPFSSMDPRLSFMVDSFDPRVHFALVCGVLSCPPIAFYASDALDD